jgi:3-oxoacyl-[acyl-carrier-protein] synthase II
VIIGSGIGGLNEFETQHAAMMTKGPSRISPFTIPKLMVNAASGQVSIKWGLRGPNTAVATACASAANAIGDAFKIIQEGHAEVMITGGSEAAITHMGLGGFAAMRALSTRNDDPTRASRPFDRDRDGFVLAEGAGILILEEESLARKRGARIYAEVLGYGEAADAYHIAQPDPESKGVILAMERALKRAGIAPETVGYINAHGTSTPLGDAAESQAIERVFGSHALTGLAVSSTKSMHGHLLGAAGAVEGIATVLALANGIIPPTTNYEIPDPECRLDYVPNVARKAPDLRVAMSNGFGFGGHNTAVIFGKHE